MCLRFFLIPILKKWVLPSTQYPLGLILGLFESVFSEHPINVLG